MNTPTTYEYVQRARGCYSVFWLSFALLLSLGFIATRNVLFVFAGGALALCVCNGVYSIVKNEQYAIRIGGGTLSWHSPRSSNAKGTINLSEVREILVDDVRCGLYLTLSSGVHVEFRSCAPPHRILEFLRENYPDIHTEFREGS